jgi:copper chaperone CopZ
LEARLLQLCAAAGRAGGQAPGGQGECAPVSAFPLSAPVSAPSSASLHATVCVLARLVHALLRRQALAMHQSAEPHLLAPPMRALGGARLSLPPALAPGDGANAAPHRHTHSRAGDCCPPRAPRAARALPQTQQAQLVHFAFRVDGLACESCAEQVSRALHQLPGVIEASVALGDGVARVRCESRVSALVHRALRPVLTSFSGARTRAHPCLKTATRL